VDQQVQGAPQEVAVVVAVAQIPVYIVISSTTAFLIARSVTFVVIARAIMVLLEAQEAQYQTLTLLPAMVVRVELEVMVV
tara:strand:- start:32 stop:271 length:240 start_codon:yes stop_codon:yes gene_type:complete